MNDFLNEAEQGEYVKKWIKKYAAGIVLLLAATLLSGIAWQKYQEYNIKKSQTAANLYNMLTTLPLSPESIKIANTLTSDFTKTPYAQLAAITLAKNNLMLNPANTQLATSELNWAMTHGPASYIKQLAQIDLAHLYIQEENYPQALNLLQQLKSSPFSGMINESIGDAYFYQKKYNSALKSYELAKQDLPPSGQSLLSMKINNLPRN